ncbi:MAG: hypothetical protein WC332_00390 [Clostridia bacterium]|jgi:hypothetical protein
MKAYCPLALNNLCQYGSSKKFEIITAKLLRCYCMKENKFIHDLKICPLKKDEKCQDQNI